MKYKYIFLVFGSLLFSFSGIKSQSNNPLIHGMRFKTPDSNKVKSLLNGAVEDASKRTLYSSTWKAKNGKVISRYSSVMINYPDANGKLQPINLSLHSDAAGWVADKQPNPCYFHSDRSTSVTIGNGKQITFNKNCTINGMLLDQHIVSLKDNDVKLDLSQGVHKELNFVTGGIETNYIFDSPLQGGVTIAEEVDIPDGCSFQKDTNNGAVQPGGGWAGNYLLMAADGKTVLAVLQAAECYDAKKQWCFANYSIQKKDGKNILVTTIPSNWLSKAVYPVTLDPLIIGATSYWTGGSTPSCLYPNFHTDSIKITIPANITVTFFTVDYAYVSSIAVNDQIPLTDGIFYLSNSCAQTDTLSCHSDTGGICYLLPFEDFHNPFTCCYPPSCSPQSFWLYAHLSRHRGGFGCDTSTIWYSKGRYSGFQYFYSAYLEGYTDSTTNITYDPGAQCSNICTVNMKATLQYGVPPYKVSHPWAAHDTIVGSYGGCVSIGTTEMPLKIPGCPYTCGKIKTIKIPPPTVVDACGDTAARVDSMVYTINPVPVVEYIPVDTAVCSGLPVKLALKSCVPGTTFSWTGTDNSSGTKDSLIDDTHDTGNVPMIVTYSISGSANGCNSSIVTTTATINPYPLVSITGDDTLVLGNSETLTAKGGGTYLWSPATGLSCTTCPNPVATPTVTTQYQVTVVDSGGCESITPFLIYVLDENIIIPNVITPNTGGINQYFAITNLQDYPNSKITITDRWGKQVYSSNNYQNDWNGGGQSDGVYYYILTLPTGKKYQGFFQIIK